MQVIEKVVPSKTTEYYNGGLWNQFTVVQSELYRRASGSPDHGCNHHFNQFVEGRVFKRALFLNCGNGWVERGMFQCFAQFELADGVDISNQLLEPSYPD